jgi:hypothetical protein
VSDDNESVKAQLAAMKAELAKHQAWIHSLAKGMLRAETATVAWDGSVIMEKDEVAGVSFPGPDDED